MTAADDFCSYFVTSLRPLWNYLCCLLVPRMWQNLLRQIQIATIGAGVDFNVQGIRCKMTQSCFLNSDNPCRLFHGTNVIPAHNVQRHGCFSRIIFYLGGPIFLALLHISMGFGGRTEVTSFSDSGCEWDCEITRVEATEEDPSICVT